MVPAPALFEINSARATVRGASCWVITDGKAGDEAQCVGVAERLGLAPELRRVCPRAPFVWLMPWGGIDPRDAPASKDSPIAPPFPDIAIASGRRAAAYLRKVKLASGGKTFTVFLKDPKSGTRTADFIWVPEHDRLRGPNVLTTLTSPHKISPERLESARMQAPYGLAAFRSPRLALIIGGDSQHFKFSESDIARFSEQLRTLAGTGVSLIATASRRTPARLSDAVRGIVLENGGFFWDGTGENPYLSLLALADALIVTADSVNMVGEAAMTGKPILLFTPSGRAPKITKFLSGLERMGALRPFAGVLEAYTYDPIDATPTIAIELARRYHDFRHLKQDRT